MRFIVAIARFLLAAFVTFGVGISIPDLVKIELAARLIIATVSFFVYALYQILQAIKEIKRSAIKSKLLTLYGMVVTLGLLYMPFLSDEISRDTIYLFIVVFIIAIPTVIFDFKYLFRPPQQQNFISPDILDAPEVKES